MEKKRILIVEDEIITALFYRRIIESNGFEVIDVVSCGNDAIVLAQQQSPDLILMDILLNGEMDGIEAVTEIQSNQEIPVIFITSYFDDETIRRANKTKPFSFLQKPICNSTLISDIRQALN